MSFSLILLFLDIVSTGMYLGTYTSPTSLLSPPLTAHSASRQLTMTAFLYLYLLSGVIAISTRATCSAFTLVHSTKALSLATGTSATKFLKHPSPLASRDAIRLHSNSINQAEHHISNKYPKFYYLMQQNPMCLERIRNSSRGFAIFAPSEEAMDNLGDSLNLLEYGCNDADMLPIIQAMSSYHLVSVPVTVDIMQQFSVVSTPVGELPVQVHDGSIYVNGSRIVQCYRFEDNVVRNYQDGYGNLLGSETVEGEGSVCLVYEMDGMICPDELWNALYECYQSNSSG